MNIQCDEPFCWYVDCIETCSHVISYRRNEKAEMILQHCTAYFALIREGRK